MKILLFGKNGQVGWEMQRALVPFGRITALDRHSAEYCGDFTKPSEIAETVKRISPDIIINCAAYTSVDGAENERKTAMLVNYYSVEAIAKSACLCGALLVHYSTDYVFDGRGDHWWKEDDRTAPLNFYGESKLAGEQAVLTYAQNYLIFRTSWVYASRGNNFIKTIIRLAGQRKHLNVINDQYGVPVGAELIADYTAYALRNTLASPQLSGIYHLVASGITTWYDYAVTIISQLRARGLPVMATDINAVPGSAFPTPACRPANSRLCTEKFRQNFFVNLPDWRHGVVRVIDELYCN